MIGPWGWHGMVRGPGLLGGLLMLLFLAAAAVVVIWLVVMVFRWASNKPTQTQSTSQPQIQPTDPVLEILRRRLAEGAITAQEFDELRQKLGV